MSNQAQIFAYATPPGDTLQETLDALGMTQVELESRTGINKKTINQIIKGKESITQKTALALEKALKVPAHFWLNMDNLYRQYLAKAEQAEAMKGHAPWLKNFVYTDLVRVGFLPAASKVGEKAALLLEFFGVSHPDGWKQTYGEMELELSFRKSAHVQKKLGAISAWLRQGEIEADKIPQKDFDEQKFKYAVESIRALTTKSPQEFRLKIQSLCAKAGVVYILVPELPGMGISGVMRWYRGRPMIQQCLRFKGNDHFWFTFFHEAKHVLQKKKKEIFLEGRNAEHEDQAREEEANNFAANLLIPEAEWQRFVDGERKPTSAGIMEFANSIDLDPGIIVGRLMHEKIIDYTHPARNLITKFEWL